VRSPRTTLPSSSTSPLGTRRSCPSHKRRCHLRAGGEYLALEHEALPPQAPKPHPLAKWPTVRSASRLQSTGPGNGRTDSRSAPPSLAVRRRLLLSRVGWVGFNSLRLMGQHSFRQLIDQKFSCLEQQQAGLAKGAGEISATTTWIWKIGCSKPLESKGLARWIARTGDSRSRGEDVRRFRLLVKV
jgi:hypothetical protein